MADTNTFKIISEKTIASIPMGVLITGACSFLYFFVYQPIERRLRMLEDSAVASARHNALEGRVDKLEAARLSADERVLRIEIDSKYTVQALQAVQRSIEDLDGKVDAGFDRLNVKIDAIKKGNP